MCLCLTLSEVQPNMLEIRVQRYSLVHLKAIDYLSNLYHFSRLPGQIELFGRLICPQLCILHSHSSGSPNAQRALRSFQPALLFLCGSAGRAWTCCLPHPRVPRGPSPPGTFPESTRANLSQQGDESCSRVGSDPACPGLGFWSMMFHYSISVFMKWGWCELPSSSWAVLIGLE